MRLEKNRHIQIVLYFIHQNRIVTSDELAALTNSSSRTIKADIGVINDVLKEAGGKIVSRKSEGYQLIVKDSSAFDEYRHRLEVINHYYLSYNSAFELGVFLRTTAILRELLACRRYLSIEELADHMFLSRSTIKQDLTRVREYLESYHLTLEARPNYGLRVSGAEHHWRLAMIGAFGINIPTIDRTIMEKEYREQVDSADYNDIRHDLLHVLREYHYTIKDNASQGLARYLIVMRSRIRKNYGHVVLDEKTKQDLALFDCQTNLVERLFELLKKNYDGFDVSADEKAFVTMYLVGYHDYKGSEISPETMKFLYPQIQKLDYEAREFNKSILGLQDPYETSRQQLLYNVARIVVRNHFQMLPYNQINVGSGYESVKKNPMAISLASYLASYFEERLFCQLNTKDTLYLAHYFDNLLEQIHFQFIPQKLITVSGLGRNYSEMLISQIEKRYGEYIASNKSYELYEVRTLAPDQVDIIVLDNLHFTYRYDYPCAAVVHRDYRSLENVLKRGIQIEKECHEIAAMLKCYKDYEFQNRFDVFRILAYKYGTDELSVNEMIKIFNRHEKRISYGRFGFALLLADWRFVQRNCFEIYRLKKPMKWNDGFSVRYVLFLSANFSTNYNLMKAFSMLISTLYSDEGRLEALIDLEQREKVVHSAILQQIKL